MLFVGSIINVYASKLKVLLSQRMKQGRLTFTRAVV